jgi:hypothetical protein
MPKGHAPKREQKRSKKKASKIALSAPVFTSEEVTVIKKKRKPREEAEG